MRALALREARRLAPFGLGGLGLTLLAWWSPWHLGGVPTLLLPVTTILVTIVLGVAAVAPDTAAGGVAFLLRLPLRPGRVAAAKTLVAAAWALPVVAPLLIESRQPYTASMYALIGLAAGLLASVISRRVLPALCVAPLIIGTWLLLGVIVPVTALDAAVGPYSMPAMAALSLGLAALAFARGDLHRASPRPALIAAVGLAPTFVLVFAGSAAAQAWTLARVVPGALRVREAVALPAGPRLALSLEATVWSGHEVRTAVLEADHAWLIPARNACRPAPSPDGRFLLLEDLVGSSGWIVDVSARTVTRLPELGTFVSLRETEPLWGPGGLLALVRGRGALEAFYPRERGLARAWRALPPGARYVGLADDGRALLADAAGVLACDLPGPGDDGAPVAPERLLRWPEGMSWEQAAPAPGGRLLVIDQAGAVHVVDLRAGGVVALAITPARRVRLDRAAHSPDGGRAAFTHADAAVSIFDLSSGERLLTVTPPPRAAFETPWGGGDPAWAPDGRAVAMPWGPVAFLGDHPAGERPCLDPSAHVHADLGRRGSVAAFVLDHVVPRDAPLSLARPFTAEPAVVLDLTSGGAR